MEVVDPHAYVFARILTWTTWVQVLAFSILTALMIAMMQHAPSLLGSTMGSWSVLPVKELPGVEDIEPKIADSKMLQER